MTFYLSKTKIDDISKFEKDLTVIIKGNPRFNQRDTRLKLFSETRNGYYIPLGKYSKWFEKIQVSREYTRTSVTFNRTLYTKETDPKFLDQPDAGRDQDVVVKEIFRSLKKTRTAFLAAHTGFGKTTIGAFCLSKLKYKTAIITYNSDVRKQWVNAIKEMSTAKTQLVGSGKLKDDMDVYLLGVRQCLRFSKKDFQDIGLVILDETHSSTKTLFEKVLFLFRPVYLIGLSATPDRKNDSLHKIMEPYFGSLKNYIFRKEVKSFTVYMYYTSYIPEKSYQVIGGECIISWRDLITSLSVNEARSKEIADHCISDQKNKILIHCARNCTANWIYDYLIENDQDAYLFTEKAKFDDTHRIVVTNSKKCREGIDCSVYTKSIIEVDTKDVRQIEGRLRQSNVVIIDIVDDDELLRRHAKPRKNWYISRGGTVHEISDMKDVQM